MIVGFSGRKQSGKTTAAGFLEDAGFNRFSFAEPVRLLIDLLLIDLGFDVEQIAEFAKDKERIIPGLGHSYRDLLKSLGTGWGRDQVSIDLWVMVARVKLKSWALDAVFDDVRYENEAALIRELGGMIIHLRRGDAEGIVDTHPSEAGIAVLPGDDVIANNDDLRRFHREVLVSVTDRVNGLASEL